MLKYEIFVVMPLYSTISDGRVTPFVISSQDVGYWVGG
jgi:hypothetical protein